MNRPEGRRGIIIVLYKYNLYHYYQIQANATLLWLGNNRKDQR
jgi:hypothetical protein